ncbi:MAG: hypothetical protein A2W91_03815 [Bacteroidetes bacterium GWF2_38_335]|nr:MAG: hypothetical protein A2W91_03815 [Bacteroidetes bacterium GWF2_38_335]OFY77391.1 MAG: hypothetical protein A2281_00945 [Bacteroidetes bacterium RIFOXYA12_FULL_38_20]
MVSLIFVFTSKTNAQCTNCVSNYPSGTFSTTSSTWTTVGTLIYGGEYSYYSVTAGSTYEWQTCGDTDFDTQLTLRQTNCTGTLLAYNDDGCSTQSLITWTATFTGTVCVLVSQYNCVSNSIGMTLQWRMSAGGSCADHSCSNPTVIGSLPYSASGLTTCGNCNNYDEFDGCGSLFMIGPEWVYTYSPAFSGWIDVTLTTAETHGGAERGAAVFVMNGCPSTVGVSCLASSTVQYPAFHDSPHVKVYLTAGTTYYIVVANGPDPYVYNGDPCINYAISVTSISQPDPNHQDCLDAIPLCFDTYNESVAYTGPGNYPSEINSSTSCLEGERNDVWYTFTVQTSGQLGFVINPAVNTDDYDWAVYNITGLTCGDIFITPGTQVSCNYSMTTGSTGPDGSTTQTSAGPSDGPFNDDLTVIAGETYVVNVSQWTVSTGGYQIIFGGTAQVVDNTGPALDAITSSPACGQSTITVEFTENVLCSSVNPGDFTVTGPGGPYSITSVYNSTCAAGGTYARSYVLTLNTPLTAGGSYSLNLVSGVTDICSHSTTLNSLAFTVTGVAGSASVTSNVSCNGGNNGVATASGSGGTAPYTYHWSTGTNSATASNLVAGTNYVTITDAVGVCNAVVSVNITQPTALAATTSSTNVNCFGQSNGSATVTASGATPPYTYNWSGGGGTGATASGLAAGTYTVTVADSRGCSLTRTVTITQPTQLTATTSSTAANCFGQANGGASVTAGGGSPGYTYSWSSGSTTASASGLAAGTYTVTVSDTHGCTVSSSATVTQPTVVAGTTSGTAANCNGQSNGSATITASGGTPAYTYLWSPGFQTSSTATGLAAGVYTVTITDSHGCTATRTYTVTQPTAIVPTMSNTSATCGNNDGSASVSVTGGTSPYTYNWSGGGGTGTTALNLYAGGYVVTITDSHGCTITGTTNVNDAGSPTASISSSTNVNCFGNCNGIATASATGGTSPYSYAWSTSANTGTTESGLCAGTATVTVTDNVGCISTATVTITQPAALSASITGSTNPTCFGYTNGTATVSVSGGSPAYSYMWSGGGGTGSTASGLAAGTYTVTVYDSHSCSLTRTVTITQPTALAASATSTPVSCFGGSNGTATVTASNGTPGYSYLWSGSGGSSTTASGLTAGTYTVTVTDANNCTVTANTTITQPTALSSSTLVNGNVSCFSGANGSATASGSGGTSPYSYLWSVSAGSQVTATATGLAAGTYSVTITDANGCSTSNTVNITQPTQLTSSASAVAVTCNGLSTGSATVAASGGTASYSYLWNAAAGSQVTATATGLAMGTYTVTVTDANGCTSSSSVTVTQPQPLASTTSQINVACFGGANGQAGVVVSGGTTPYSYNWTGGSTSSSVSGLAAGSITVTVTDFNGCTLTNSFTITQPTALAITIDAVSPNCGNTDGTATANVTGGVTAYAYQWGPATGYQTTQTATALSSGSYFITVTDANNCTISGSVNLVDNGAAVIDIDNVVNNVCYGDTLGYAHVTIISGGTAPFGYLWDFHGVTVDYLENLPAGTYSVTVSDANGCNSTDNITITQPTAVSGVMTDYNNISCNGFTDGSITYSASGGTPPYTYLWDDAVPTTDAIVSNLPAGSYNITITDSNGCTFTDGANITQPPVFSAMVIDFDNVSCYGGNDGYALIQPSGGSAPYTYLWSNGDNTSVVDEIFADVYYYVTITDNHGCEKIDSVMVNQPTQLDLSDMTITPATCGGTNGQIVIDPDGGTPGYTYLWSNSDTDDTAGDLAAGSYSVTVTDSNGCTAEATGAVTSAGGGEAELELISNVLCYGGNTGMLAVNVTGGTAPFEYSWSNGVNHNSTEYSDTIYDLVAGDYYVTINDVNDCQAIDTITVTQPNQLTDVLTINHVLCYGESTGSATIVVSGGTPPYSYIWSNGQTSFNAVNLPAGGLAVTVTDANGCQIAHTNIGIVQPAEPLKGTITISQAIACAGETGSLSVDASGGSPTYSYVWDANTGSQTTSTAFNLFTGTYFVTVYDVNGCSLSGTGTLIQPEAILFVTDEVTPVSCQGKNDAGISTSAYEGTGSLVFIWSNGATTDDITGLTAGEYIVTITDENDCSVIDTIIIEDSEISCYDLEIPSAFTPNSDGVNDTWEIGDIISVDNVGIEIYNRWGQIIFSFTGTGAEYAETENQWDGKYNGVDVPFGSYVFILKINDDEPIDGVVTVIR